MRARKLLPVVRASLASLAALPVACASGGEIDAGRAFAHAKALVEMGPRPPGSPALEQARAYIEAELRKIGLSPERDPFEAETPLGPIAMANVVATIPGESPRSIVFGGHFDTLKLDGFVGANDAGSSTAILLELARVLQARGKPRATLRFAFFDGEEALVTWSAMNGRDNTYGSRHLAERWKQDGTLAQIGALLVFDMVGDRDLQIFRETHATGWLVALLAQGALDLGHEEHFFKRSVDLEDDFTPFMKAGVPAFVDLIDYAYGPPRSPGAGAFWHTTEDTLDKISGESIKIVGDVVLAALPEIESRVVR